MRVNIIKLLESQKNPIRSRFAPAPTGYLHLGHVVSSLYVFGITRKLSGEVSIRIEDHDRSRCRPGFDSAIQEDLEWLGLVPDHSPWPGFGQFDPTLRQSTRNDIYGRYLKILEARGLLYLCDCTRGQMTRNALGEIHHEGLCRKHAVNPDRPHGIRLRLPDREFEFVDLRLGRQEQNPLRATGDLLVKDRDDQWTYHFSCTIDDTDQGINLIIRGVDLLSSTGRQLALKQLIAEPDVDLASTVYLHHPLVVDASGRKLGKRFLSSSIRQMRLDGASRNAVLGLAAFLAGKVVAPGPLELEGALELFGEIDHNKSGEL